MTALDVEQPRLSRPAPLPAPGSPLNQTFVAGHDGLAAVEVQVVAYGDAPEMTGTLTLALWGPDGRLVAQETRQGLTHNAPLRLSFPSQPASAGQIYRLEVQAETGNQATLWAYALDGYRHGALRQAGAEVGGDLTFKTYYTYRWTHWVRSSARAAADLAGLAVPLWLVLFAPGLAALDLGRLGGFEQSRWARWGAALALSLALLPLVWLWASTLGLGWSRPTLGAVYAAVGALVAGRGVLAAARAALRPRVRVRAAAFPGTQPVPVRFADPSAARRWGWHDTAMAAVVAGSVLLRLLATRDLPLPAWVDSSHHAYVALLLAEGGRLPATYGPWLGDGIFTYHFGVHTVFVALDWFSSRDITQIMLLAGQVLNGLMPLAVYAGTAALTGRRWAGLAAAFYVGVVSFFPGYYATWGRYSQLAGLLVLPPAMGATRTLLVTAAVRPTTGSTAAASSRPTHGRASRPPTAAAAPSQATIRPPARACSAAATPTKAA